MVVLTIITVFLISLNIGVTWGIMNKNIKELREKLELQKPSTVYIDSTQTLQQQYDYVNKFMSDPSFGELDFKTQQKYQSKLSLLTELMALGV